MKKYIIIFSFLMLVFPVIINAKERLEISCDKVELKINEETNCKIIAKDLNFVITGISGKLNISENISIINSNYNNKKWMMLDDEFNIKDINLINENPIKEDTVEIASFKIKVTSKKMLKEDILLDDLLIGDQKYEKRKIYVKKEIIHINRNNIINYIIYGGIILLIIIGIFCIMKGKK